MSPETDNWTHLSTPGAAYRAGIGDAAHEFMGRLCGCGRGGMHEPAVHEWAGRGEGLRPGHVPVSDWLCDTCGLSTDECRALASSLSGPKEPG